MADFSALLKRPAGMAKKPEALPQDTYPGVIKSFEIGDANVNKTPYVRVHCGFTGWPDSGQPEDFEGVDINKRQLRRDFFLTDEAMWRLDELIRSCGISAEGREYEEVLPELVGQQVLLGVSQYLNKKTNEVGNQLDTVVGLNA